MFENSSWLSFPAVEANLTRSTFRAKKKPVRAALSICALGYFEAFVNGAPVSSDRLVPAMSEYEKRDLSGIHMPIYDEFSYTVYYLDYDVTALVSGGGNVVAAHIGSGWYGQTRSRNEGMPRWGDNCLVFELLLEYADGSSEKVVSTADNTVWKQGWIKSSQLYFGEVHDMTCYEPDWADADYDDSGWAKPVVRKAPDAALLPTDFPKDAVVRSIAPRKIFSWGDVAIYDLGETASGAAVIRFYDFCADNEAAIVRYADALREDGSLEFHYVGGTARMQRDVFINAGDFRSRELYPHFTWHAGRYVEICGNAELLRFDVIQTDLRKTADFHCENRVLQWLFDAYVLTQQANVHGCVPSDCPHRERLGYTGDGQLTSDAVMTIFDAEKLYRKWLRDIRDGQDKTGGHVQHTAPFYGGGGGPGGWGGAIVIVPYNFYKHYGDLALVREYLPSMKLYIGYMLSHSEDGAVVREEEGGWCLGDWVPPYNKVLLPEPFVNTYFLAKCSRMLGEMCGLCGEADEAEKYGRIADDAARTVERLWFDPGTGSFLGGVQGADAFAADIGAGDGRTLANLARRYEELGTFDTGIFGTDILIRVLFENGFASLALRLLVNEEKDTSFGGMLNSGATTLWENWDGCDSRCHPMYGAVTAYIFRYILGVRTDGDEVRVEPAYLPELGSYSGSLVRRGRRIYVSVSYDGGEQKTEFSVD